MSIVFSSIEVINTLARGVLVGSSVWNPNGNGLKDEGREGRGVSKCKGKEEERAFAGQGFGLGKTALLKIGETWTQLNASLGQ